MARLLTHAATGAPLTSGEDQSLGGRDDDERQLQWLLAGGLGPLLHHALADGVHRLPPAQRDRLLGADLTARVRHGEQAATLLEVLDACEQVAARPTLLKGISVAAQFYPEAHLRPMADIDVLLEPLAAAQVEAALVDAGYVQLDYPEDAGHHHRAPLCHPRHGTVVELHTALFPSDSPLADAAVFALDNVRRHTVAARWRGRSVGRLSPPMQLAYIASSWLNDLTLCGVHPAFLVSLFDAVHLLRACDRALDWAALLDRLGNDLATASLHTLAHYLPRFGLAPWPAPVRAALAHTQRWVGPVQLRLIHAMLDRCLVGARPWPALLPPPPVPGRYVLRHQISKRVLARLRRAA